MAVQGHHCCARAFSGCPQPSRLGFSPAPSWAGLLSLEGEGFHCSGFSCCRARLVTSGLSSCSAWLSTCGAQANCSHSQSSDQGSIQCPCIGRRIFTTEPNYREALFSPFLTFLLCYLAGKCILSNIWKSYSLKESFKNTLDHVFKTRRTPCLLCSSLFSLSWFFIFSRATWSPHHSGSSCGGT